MEDNTGKLKIKSGGTFTPTSTSNFIIDNAILEINSGSTVTSASSIVLNIASGGTLTQGNYTAAGSALTFSTITVQSSGLIDHLANTTAQTHVMNLGATTIDYRFRRFHQCRWKGYTGGTENSASNGSGLAPGVTDASYGGGGGHGGNGGAGREQEQQEEQQIVQLPIPQPWVLVVRRERMVPPARVVD